MALTDKQKRQMENICVDIQNKFLELHAVFDQHGADVWLQNPNTPYHDYIESQENLLQALLCQTQEVLRGRGLEHISDLFTKGLGIQEMTCPHCSHTILCTNLHKHNCEFAPLVELGFSMVCEGSYLMSLSDKGKYIECSKKDDEIRWSVTTPDTKTDGMGNKLPDLYVNIEHAAAAIKGYIDRQ